VAAHTVLGLFDRGRNSEIKLYSPAVAIAVQSTDRSASVVVTCFVRLDFRGGCVGRHGYSSRTGLRLSIMADLDFSWVVIVFVSHLIDNGARQGGMPHAVVVGRSVDRTRVNSHK
jgi:hypothetical protein